MARKIVSCSGYEGFIAQLKEGEALYLRILEIDHTTRDVEIQNSRHFEDLVYCLDGFIMKGFFAKKHVKNVKIYRTPATYAIDIETPSYVHRPTEALALYAVMTRTKISDLVY